MCHVLVTSDANFSTPIEKKKFLEQTKREIKKKIKKPIIMFVFKNEKNSKKILSDYNKNHPRAIVWS